MAGISTDTIRRITIKGEGQASLDSLASSVDRVKVAQDQLNRATLTNAAAQERATAATAAAAALLERFAKAGDNSAIAQEKIAKAQDKAARMAEELAVAENGLTAAQNRLAQATSTTASVTDISSKKVLSAAEAYRRQTLAVVDGAQQQNMLARAVKTATAAYEQGVLGDVNSAQAKAALASRIHLLNQKYGEVSSATRGLAGETAALESAMAPMLKMFLALGALNFARTVMADTASLSEQAQQLTVSVAALQAYRAEFLVNGVAVEKGNTLIQRFSKSVGEAKDTAGPARAAFTDLGVAVDDLSSTEGALSKAAAKLLAIADANERARLEAALFGRSGMELEPVLTSLAKPIDVLIAKGRELGMVLDDDLAKKADEAADKIALSWAQLKTSLAPIIATVAVGISYVFNPPGLEDLKRQAAEQAANDNKRWNKFAGPVPGSSTGLGLDGVTGADGSVTVGGESRMGGWSLKGTGLLENQAQLRKNAETAGLEAVERAKVLAVEQQAELVLKAQGRDQEIINLNYARAKEIVDASAASQGTWTSKQIESVAATAAMASAAEKLKQTFKSFLADLGEDARIAGLSTAQRSEELAVIKAAQIAQKERGVQDRNLLQTYAGATKELGAQKVSQVELAEGAKRTAAFERQVADQMAVSGAALTSSRYERDLALQIATKQVELGRELTEQEKAQLETLQSKNDATRLKDDLADMREEVSLAGLASDERERQQAILQVMRDTHGALTEDQKREVSGLVDAKNAAQQLASVADGIHGSFQDLFTNVLSGGKDAFQSLVDSIKSYFVKLLAWMATEAIAKPIIVPVVESVTGTAGGLAGGLDSLGGLLGFANPSASQDETVKVTGVKGGLGTATSATSLLGSTTLSKMLGGVGLGSMASSLVFGSKNSSDMGGTAGAAIGGMIGSIIPGIGTLIGSAVGGLLGGGLGSLTGTSNKATFANFTAGGGYSLGKLGDSNTQSLTTKAATSITAAVKALSDAGLALTNNIQGFSIGNDKSYLYTASGKQKLSKGNDVGTVVDAALAEILKTASGTSANAQGVLSYYKGTGGINSNNIQQVADDLAFAKSIENFDFGVKDLTQSEQTLQSINEQFDTALSKAKTLGLDTSALTSSRDAAVQKVIGDFNKQTAQGIEELSNPVGAAMDSLLSDQRDRLKEATAIGADITQVQRQAMLETQDALKGYIDALTPANDNLSTWEQNIKAIAKAESDANAAAVALGIGLDQVQAAAGSARAMLTGDFNTQISAAVLKIVNPDQAAYNELLATQTQRIKDAIAVGADLNTVYQLNTLEQQQLTEQQGAAAAQAAALEQQAAEQAAEQAAKDAAAAAAAIASQHRDLEIELLKETGDTIGATRLERQREIEALDASLVPLQEQIYAAQDLQSAFGSLSDGISDIIQTANTAASAAETAATSWGSAHDALVKSSQALLISDQSLSPQQKYQNAGMQFDQLRSAAMGGNAGAASDLASFASQFLQTSYQYNASTAAYGQDFSYVQKTLSEVAGFSAGQQSLMQQQADALKSAVTLLQSIKESIAQTVENTSTLSDMKTQIARLTQKVDDAMRNARIAA